MNFENIPAWIAVPAAVLLILGGLLTVIGSLGLARLRHFYQRIHSPAMGSTLGLGCVLLASMLISSVMRGRPVAHEILITVFMVTTTPVTIMLLMHAAVRRPKDPPSPDSVN